MEPLIVSAVCTLALSTVYLVLCFTARSRLSQRGSIFSRSEKVTLAILAGMIDLALWDAMSDSHLLHTVDLTVATAAFAVLAGYAAVDALRTGVAHGRYLTRGDRRFAPLYFWYLVGLRIAVCVTCSYLFIFKAIPMWFTH